METPSRTSGTQEVAQWCAEQGLPADVVGRWVWIRFQARPAAEVREQLKAAGFRWVQKRGQWAHACGHFRPFNPRIVDARQLYGSVPVSELQAVTA